MNEGKKMVAISKQNLDSKSQYKHCDVDGHLKEKILEVASRTFPKAPQIAKNEGFVSN
jgi:hypothetical protein